MHVGGSQQQQGEHLGRASSSVMSTPTCHSNCIVTPKCQTVCIFASNIVLLSSKDQSEAFKKTGDGVNLWWGGRPGAKLLNEARCTRNEVKGNFASQLEWELNLLKIRANQSCCWHIFFRYERELFKIRDECHQKINPIHCQWWKGLRM